MKIRNLLAIRDCTISSVYSHDEADKIERNLAALVVPTRAFGFVA